MKIARSGCHTKAVDRRSGTGRQSFEGFRRNSYEVTQLKASQLSPQFAAHDLLTQKTSPCQRQEESSRFLVIPENFIGFLQVSTFPQIPTVFSILSPFRLLRISVDSRPKSHRRESNPVLLRDKQTY